MNFWKIFYNIIIVPLLWISFRTLGILNEKASRALKGREQLFDTLKQKVDRIEDAKHRIWFHSSSMGEFEQAKPIIAELKKQHPNFKIIVSFFSSSGFDHSQSYKLADIITYIPFDSFGNANKFVEILKPTLAVVVRYDIWPNHIWALKKSEIPIVLASATLRKKSPRKYPLVKKFHRRLYNMFDYILTVSDDDKKSFESFDLTMPGIEIIGDTRYDQVWQKSAQSKERKIIDERIIKNKKVLVIGSSWKEDEEVILDACNTLFDKFQDFLIILVPHEPTVENLDRIENEINGKQRSIRFSNLTQYKDERIIIIDSVGILMSLYQYAHIAYVGGSFRSGVHNVLEPAAYGVPVLFGPKHTNSQEAISLVGSGSAFTINNSEELMELLIKLLTDDRMRKECGHKALSFVEKNLGATNCVISYLEKTFVNTIK